MPGTGGSSRAADGRPEKPSSAAPKNAIRISDAGPRPWRSCCVQKNCCHPSQVSTVARLPEEEEEPVQFGWGGPNLAGRGRGASSGLISLTAGSTPVPATRARRPMAGLLPCKQEIGVQLSSGPPIFSGALPSGIVNWSVKPVPIRLRGPIPHAPTTATHSVSVRRAAFEAASCTFDSCRGNQKYLGV